MRLDFHDRRVTLRRRAPLLRSETTKACALPGASCLYNFNSKLGFFGFVVTNCATVANSSGSLSRSAS